jgi:hypothetical protein
MVILAPPLPPLAETTIAVSRFACAAAFAYPSAVRPTSKVLPSDVRFT